MFLYIHVLACWWFYVVNDAKRWVPNMDFIIINLPPPSEYEIYYASVGRKYWKSFYTAIYLFGVGEVSPRTTFEVTVFITTPSSWLSHQGLCC